MDRRSFVKKLAGVDSGVAINQTAHAAEHTSFKNLSQADKRRALFVNPYLLTHEGKQVRFYDDLIKDKIVLINFMFTSCTARCPLTTANLAKLQHVFGERLGRDIFMYSVSLDPEHDTTERLAAFRSHFKAKPAWRFLTGNKADIDALRKSLGFAYADQKLDADKEQHLGMVKYGIEPLGRWAACPAMSDPKVIVQYVNWLEPNGKRPDRSINGMLGIHQLG